MPRVPSYFYRQSGVVAVKRERGGEKILLVSSRGGKRWVIPKGVVEEALSPGDSAVNEAWEEGGVRGTLHPETSVGTYEYRKWGGTCTVQVFALDVTEVHDEWPESDRRKRRWLSRSEAAQAVREEGLRRIILNGKKGEKGP